MAKKPKKTKPSKGAGSFHILDVDADFSERVHQGLEKVLLRRKNRAVDFSTQDQVRSDFLPLRSFLMQWALKSWGIPHQSVVEIIAKDKTGKTSLLYNMLGGFMEAGSPCCVIVGENKPLGRAWAARCLSSDPKKAAVMCRKLHVIKCSNLDEMHEILVVYLESLRDPKSDTAVPMEVPIVVAIDPWGKLTTRGEAAGVYNYAGLKDADTKGIAEGSNLERSKWNAEWSRKITAMQRRFNFMLVIVNHQNMANVMKATRLPAFLPQSVVDLTNRTKPGGEATNQIAGIQIIMVEAGLVKEGDRVVGKKIRARVFKNSYGPEGREFQFVIRGESGEDSSTWLTPGVDHGIPLVLWLTEAGLLGFTMEKNRYCSPELGIRDLSLTEAARALVSHPDLIPSLQRLGEQFKMEGYIDLYDVMMTRKEPPPNEE